MVTHREGVAMKCGRTVLRAGLLGSLILLVPGSLAPSLVSPSFLRGEEPGEGRRVICDPQDPEHDCPGYRCLCSDDAFEIAFQGSSTNVLDLVRPQAGQRIAASVILDTRSEGVSAWSYGVEHDDAHLTILAATAEDTAGEAALRDGFFAIHFSEIETCRNDPDPRCRNPEPGTGFISAGVLSFFAPVYLEVRRNSVARVTYAMEEAPGLGGTRLEIVDYLRLKGGSGNDVMLTVEGRSRRPSTVVNGVVRSIEIPPGSFRRGDYDASGRVNIIDAIGLLGYLFLGIGDPGCLDAGDADDNGILRANDAVVILGYLFLGTAAPPAPGPAACGVDPREEEPDLGCTRACP